MAAIIPILSVPMIQNMMIGLTAVRGALIFLKQSQIKSFQYSAKLAKETDQGPFHTVYTLDGKSISAEKVSEDLGKEEVICVKRCCCSLTGWFPSGVFTVATWPLAGTAVRHEFILLHTTKFVVLIEIGLDGKKNSATSIIIKSASSGEEKKQAEKELLQKKWWTRTMKELEGIDLGLLQFRQITSLISLWILANRAGGCNYTIIQKNCKGLARSILYFSKKSTDYWDVLYSFWGIFTDKPFLVFWHLDMILIEKIFVNSGYLLSKQTKALVKETIEWLEKIRIDRLAEKDIESQIDANTLSSPTLDETAAVLENA